MSTFDFQEQAREHNDRMEKERFNNHNKNVTATDKFPPDFPDGEQIEPGVYDQGNGMIIVGDKF